MRFVFLGVGLILAGLAGLFAALATGNDHSKTTFKTTMVTTTIAGKTTTVTKVSAIPSFPPSPVTVHQTKTLPGSLVVRTVSGATTTVAGATKTVTAPSQTVVRTVTETTPGGVRTVTQTIPGGTQTVTHTQTVTQTQTVVRTVTMPGTTVVETVTVPGSNGGGPDCSKHPDHKKCP